MTRLFRVQGLELGHLLDPKPLNPEPQPTGYNTHHAVDALLIWLPVEGTAAVEAHQQTDRQMSTQTQTPWSLPCWHKTHEPLNIGSTLLLLPLLRQLLCRSACCVPTTCLYSLLFQLLHAPPAPPPPTNPPNPPVGALAGASVHAQAVLQLILGLAAPGRVVGQDCCAATNTEQRVGHQSLLAQAWIERCCDDLLLSLQGQNQHGMQHTHTHIVDIDEVTWTARSC